MMVSRKVKWKGHVAYLVAMINMYNILIGKSDEKREKNHTWEDNIKIVVKEICCRCVDWIDLAQDRHQWRVLVSTVSKLQIPKKYV
jgi:hypothetical protein